MIGGCFCSMKRYPYIAVPFHDSALEFPLSVVEVLVD